MHIARCSCGMVTELMLLYVSLSRLRNMVYSYKLVTLNMGEEHGIQLQVSYIKYGRGTWYTVTS